MKNDVVCSGKFLILRCGFVMLAALVAGCAGPDRSTGHFERPGEGFAERPPPFLAGPAGVLLTNATDFSARVVAEVSNFSNQIQTFSGVILGQGSHVIFTPVAGGVYFIWDMKESGGYVLNEALQGYAPITSTGHVINITADAEIAGPVSDKINGHPSKRADVIMTLDEGPAAQFTVWRARDLNGFPVRIKSVNGRSRLTLNFSDIKLEALPREIFLPPNGFTKYADADAMMTELIVRKATARKSGAPAVNEQAPGPGGGRRPSQLNQ